MEPEVFLRHIENEETHWWFKSRRKIICSIIERNLLSEGKKLNILDYGAGSGTNVEILSSFGEVYVYEKDEKTSKFLIEKYLLRIFNFPFGLSLILIARKIK